MHTRSVYIVRYYTDSDTVVLVEKAFFLVENMLFIDGKIHLLSC